VMKDYEVFDDLRHVCFLLYMDFTYMYIMAKLVHY